MAFDLAERKSITILIMRLYPKESTVLFVAYIIVTIVIPRLKYIVYLNSERYSVPYKIICDRVLS